MCRPCFVSGLMSELSFSLENPIKNTVGVETVRYFLFPPRNIIAEM